MWMAFAVVLFIVLFVLALLASAKQEAERTRIWGGFAEARGLSLVTTNNLFSEASIIEGSVDEVKVTIDTFTERSGSSDNRRSKTYTRVVASGPHSLLLDASIYAEHAFSGLGKMLGFQDVEVGDAAFDDTFVVKADDPEAAHVLLDVSLRAALLKAGSDVWFRYERGIVTVRWRGAERNTDVLGTMLDLAVAAANTGGSPPPKKKKKRKQRPRTEAMTD